MIHNHRDFVKEALLPMHSAFTNYTNTTTYIFTYCLNHARNKIQRQITALFIHVENQLKDDIEKL